MEHPIKAGISTAVAAGLALVSAQASGADFYLGGSIGEATLETSENLEGLEFDFESNDTAFKLFGGYMFNDYVGVELAYHDFGDQTDRIGLSSLGFDGGEYIEIDGELSGFSGQLVGQYPIGPVDLFAKVGLLAYDLEADFNYVDPVFDTGFSENVDDDGSDMIYGVGARYNVGQFGIRAEYEVIDVSDFDDAYVLSIGVEYSFAL